MTEGALPPGTITTKAKAIWQKTRKKKRFLEDLEARLERSKKFGQDLLKETDRGCALVAAAFLDEKLLELLQMRMIPRATTDKFESFFRGLGPLATFAARTHLAYLLRFFGTNVYQDLCRVRDIRNRFAHASEQIDFSDSEIKDWSAKLLEHATRATPTTIHVSSRSSRDLLGLSDYG
jgi:hypothetical protein